MLGSLGLVGCPAGNYTEYSLVNKDLKKSEFGYHYTVDEHLDFKIKAGTYFSFVKSLESGISTSFHFAENEQIALFKNLDITVFSKSFGALKLLDQTRFNQIPRNQAENFMIFGRKLEKTDFKRKRIKNDTIVIELNGTTILEFARTE